MYVELFGLDGTYITICVLENNKSRYRTRKGEIATNDSIFTRYEIHLCDAWMGRLCL